RSWCLFGVWSLVFGVSSGSSGYAQPNSAAQANALMQLMTSQLPVDISSPVVAKAEFDPPVIAVGDQAVYRISLNALEPSVHCTQPISVPRGLLITPSARGQIIQQRGDMARPLTA